MSNVKTENDQERCVADLRRNGQGFTADRVEALSEVGFAIFKRDLLARFAADGRFSAWPPKNAVNIGPCLYGGE